MTDDGCSVANNIALSENVIGLFHLFWFSQVVQKQRLDEARWGHLMGLVAT